MEKLKDRLKTSDNAVTEIFPIFKDVDRITLKQIFQNASYRSLDEGEYVQPYSKIKQGFTLIAKGAIQIFILSSDGKEFVVDTLCSGARLDEFLFSESKSFHLPVLKLKSISSTLIIHFDMEDIISCSSNRHFLVQSDALLKKIIESLIIRLEDLAMHPLNKRLARLLLRLYNLSLNNSEVRLHRFTQTNLALITNASRPKVNQCLMCMAKSGAISIENGLIRVLDINKLATCAK